METGLQTLLKQKKDSMHLKIMLNTIMKNLRKLLQTDKSPRTYHRKGREILTSNPILT